MHRYHLAKLIDLAGGLDSRKRVQKIVYLLQAAGCDLGADYHLHHYGPYSTDVARTLDDLVRSDVLEETRSSLNNGGRRFSYKTAASGGEQIADLEKTRRGELLQRHLEPFEAFAAELAGAHPWHLEVASTIAFYVRDGREDWEAAKRKAFDFKKVEPGTPAATAAEALARRALEFRAAAPADAA